MTRRWPFGLVTVVVIAIAVAIAVGSQGAKPPGATSTISTTATLPPTAGPSALPTARPTATPISTPEPPPSQSPDPLASPTGMRWEVALEKSRQPSTGSFYPVAWSGGFVALDEGRQRMEGMWLSADGHRWRSRALPFRGSELGTWAMPLERGLALINNHGNLITAGFDIWTSTDGREWVQLGGLSIVPKDPKNQVQASIFVVRNQFVVVATIGRMLCCGLGPSPLAAAASTSRAQVRLRMAATAAATEDGQWVYLSDDAVTWERHRVRGARSLGSITWADGAYEGIAFGPDGLTITRSADLIEWEMVAPLPVDMDPDGPHQLVRTTDGYVLMGDTGYARGTTTGPHMTLWTIDGEGAATEVFDREGWGPGDVASVASTVVVVGYEFSEHDELARPLALVSVDGGSTYELSAGWPGMVGGRFSSVAIADGAVVAGMYAPTAETRQVFAAKLP